MNLGWGTIGVFVAASVLGFINMNYDRISPFRDEGDRLAAQCDATAERAGFSARQTRQVCDCAVENVREWRKENPEAEYTEQVHEDIMLPCIPGASQARARANSQAQAMERRPVRVSRPTVRQNDSDDSNGWGNGAGGSGSEWGD